MICTQQASQYFCSTQHTFKPYLLQFRVETDIITFWFSWYSNTEGNSFSYIMQFTTLFLEKYADSRKIIRIKLWLQKWRGVCPRGQTHLVIFLQDSSYTIYCYSLISLFPHTPTFIFLSPVFGVFLLTSSIHTILVSIHTDFPPSLLAELNLVTSFQFSTNTVFLSQSLSFTHSLYSFYPHIEIFKMAFHHHSSFSTIASPVQTASAYSTSLLVLKLAIPISHPYQLPCLASLSIGFYLALPLSSQHLWHET